MRSQLVCFILILHKAKPFYYRLHTIQDDGGAPSNGGNPDYAEVDSSGALLISNGKVQVSGTQQGPYATTTLVEPQPFSQVIDISHFIKKQSPKRAIYTSTFDRSIKLGSQRLVSFYSLLHGKHGADC